LTRQPLFQVMVTRQTTPAADLELPGLRVGFGSAPAAPTAKFDLTLAIADDGGAITVGAEYASELFERRTVERLLEQWERVLSAGVSAPERRVSSLELLEEGERRDLERWNATLAELVSAQAKRRPDTVAVRSEGRQWSYAALERAATGIAAGLQAVGVRR